MRKMIAVAAVLAVTSVQAEELKFGDINYFFQTGQFNLQADINSVYNRSSTGGAKSEERGYVLDTRLTYGVMDNLNVFLDLNYNWDMETEQTGVADFSSDGLRDPSIGALYRLTNQDSSAYNIDLGAVAHLSLMDAEQGVAGEDGNAASGRNSLELLARMGRKWNIANEWQLTAGLVYNMDGEIEQQGTPAVDIETDASTDFYLRAAYQYRPVNEFMMEVALQVTRVGEFDAEAGGATSTNDEHIDYDLTFTAKYLILENLIGRFNFGMGRNPDYDIDNVEVTGRRENFYGLGVDYLF